MDNRIVQVNNEINKLEYKTDSSNWGDEDYWASPTEMLAEGGDCEDYALAKYFKLRELGIPADKLKITAVTLPDNIGHMVLCYTENNEIYVLDNMIEEIVLLRDKPDFTLIYSFNEENMYVGKHNKLIGTSDNIKKWQDLLELMEEEEEDSETGDDYEDFERLS